MLVTLVSFPFFPKLYTSVLMTVSPKISPLKGFTTAAIVFGWVLSNFVCLLPGLFRDLRSALITWQKDAFLSAYTM